MNLLYKPYAVEPASFKYSAQLIAVFQNDSGKNLIEKGDLLIAYSGNECRGITEARFWENSNPYSSSLTFFSNSDQDIVNFKIINPVRKREVFFAERLPFIINGNFGNIHDPFLLTQKESQSALNMISRNSVKVFPNPVNDKLQIHSEFRIQSVTISGLRGNCIRSLTKISTNKLTLETNFLDTGIFSLKIETENGIFFRKLIKTVYPI